MDRRQRAQSFHHPRTRETPLVASQHRIKAAISNAPKSGSALVRCSRRNFCLVAVQQPKQPTVNGIEGAWIKLRVGQGPLLSCNNSGIAPVKVRFSNSNLRCMQVVPYSTTLVDINCVVMAFDVSTVLANHLSHQIIWKGWNLPLAVQTHSGSCTSHVLAERGRLMLAQEHQPEGVHPSADERSWLITARH